MSLIVNLSDHIDYDKSSMQQSATNEDEMSYNYYGNLDTPYQSQLASLVHVVKYVHQQIVVYLTYFTSKV